MLHVVSAQVYAGRDASAVFAAIHANDAYALKASYVLGKLADPKEHEKKSHVTQREKMPVSNHF